MSKQFSLYFKTVLSKSEFIKTVLIFPASVLFVNKRGSRGKTLAAK
jgi:hypothetical protein